MGVQKVVVSDVGKQTGGKMNRLTEKNNQGKWELKGVSWDELKPGAVISKNTYEKMYGALCKLKDYEETGLSPTEVETVNDFEQSQTGKMLKELNKEQRKHRWIPVKEHLPENNNFVLLSFSNFTLPMIGRYEQQEDGSGVWYLGDCDEGDTCLANDLFVNAWMELPEVYKE